MKFSHVALDIAPNSYDGVLNKMPDEIPNHHNPQLLDPLIEISYDYIHNFRFLTNYLNMG
jgi:hypothetical protein